MEPVSMDQPLPRVAFTARFHRSFGALLRETIRRFRCEEGGYLLGRFEGDRIQVDGFYHDRDAQTSVGDIQLSTGAFDRATALGRRQGGQSIVGTWHLHPPGYGAGYSPTDEQMLFIDRMVLNATDPGDYDAPKVHMIVPGLDLGGMRAYTLDVESPLRLTPADHSVAADGRGVGRARFGLLVRNPRRNVPGLIPRPMERRLLRAALRVGRLAGIWRRCPDQPACVRWERLFAENLVRKIHEAGPEGARLPDRPMVYSRLLDGGRADCYEFVVPGADGRAVFPEPPLSLEVLLQNPDTGAADAEEFPPEARVSELIRRVRERHGLPGPPILWTLLNEPEASSLRERTRVEEYGKVYLPEDLRLDRVCAQRETAEVPIYWESPDLAPEAVLRLRTHRFASMGYDLDRLRGRHVVIAGLGLLGSGIARALGMLAVGRLTLIDNGRVDWVDLYRQSLYAPGDVGRLKAEAAAEELRPMGSVCRPLELEIPSVLQSDARSVMRRLRELDSAIDGADLVVGVLDSFSTRAVLQAICRARDVSFLSASLDFLPQFGLTQGTVSLFARSAGQCYACGSGSRPRKRQDRGACTNAPLEFPGIVNALASKVAVDALTREPEPSPQTYRIYDDYRIEHQPLGDPAEGCPICALGREGGDTDLTEWSKKLLTWLLS
jgi:adenylyltransferase/sulfurtransferase